MAASTTLLLAACALATCLVARDGARLPISQVDLASNDPAPALRRSELCSSANAVGAGLQGEYFAGARWQGGVALTRVDAAVDFDATLDWPEAGTRPRSVRWQGWVKAPLSGPYRFHVDAPGARVRVAQQVVVDDGVGRGEPVAMHAGRYYAIVVELPELGSGASRRIALEWTAPHGARYVVPHSLLFLPTETVPRRV